MKCRGITTMIFAIGDSHSIFYHNSPVIKEHWVSFAGLPVTWCRLVSEDLPLLNIGTVLGNGHETYEISAGDTVLYSYGWNDVQKHISKYGEGEWMGEIDRQVKEYVQLISVHREKYCIDPIINCIYPIPLKTSETMTGTEQERSAFTVYANMKLRQLTAQYGIKFFDIYQYITVNDRINPSLTTDGIHLDYENSELRKKIDEMLMDTANRFGFIVPTCCRTQVHVNQLLRCLGSIRTFYPHKDIVLINDSDLQLTVADKRIHCIKSKHKGSADQQIFSVLGDTSLFERAVCLQDSMILRKPLDGVDSDSQRPHHSSPTIQFLWHFTNHRMHWNTIHEPATKDNKRHGIVTHTDLIRHNINTYYTDPFRTFAIDRLDNMNTWCGCFGSLCILSKKTLKHMDRVVPFIDTFVKATSNRDRRANESIFSLICHFVYPDKNWNNSYDGLYYDGVTPPAGSDVDTGFDGLKWCAVHPYIAKVSFNR